MRLSDFYFEKRANGYGLFIFRNNSDSTMAEGLSLK